MPKSLLLLHCRKLSRDMARTELKRLKLMPKTPRREWKNKLSHMPTTKLRLASKNRKTRRQRSQRSSQLIKRE